MSPSNTAVSTPPPGWIASIRNAKPTAYVVGFAAIACWFTFVWVTFVSIPGAHRVFTEFRMRVPWITERILEFSILIFLGVLIGAAIASWSFRRHGWPILFCLIPLPVIFSLFLFGSVLLSMWQLQEGLRGARADFWVVLWETIRG